MTSEKILIAVATYNERENLPRLVDAVLTAVPTADMLVVDDNSPDGTGTWCDEHAAKEPRLKCIHREGKLGLGTATLAALRFALEHGYELVVTMDADFSHPPERLPAVIAAAAEADVVIGSRYCPGGKIDGWPFHRRVASHMVNTAARLAAGLKPKDCSGAYRCYRTDILRAIDLGEIRCEGFAYLEEILWLLQRAGARFAEVPITFTERTAGHSKLDLRETIQAAKTMLRLASWRVTRPKASE